MDYYKILELDPITSTYEEITANFRRLSLKYHPMKTSENLSDDEQGAIMVSLDSKTNKEDACSRPLTSSSINKSLPDVLSTELQSLTLLADHDNNCMSFQLLEEDERLFVGFHKCSQRNLCSNRPQRPNMNSKDVTSHLRS